MRYVAPLLALVAFLGCASRKFTSTVPSLTESADEGVRLAAKVDPLPHSQEAAMFDHFASGEKVDLALVYQALVGDQFTLRAHAAKHLGTHGDESSIPYLIDALRDQSMHVGADYDHPGKATTRYWANASLKILTRQDFGFVWDDPVAKRDEAIVRWVAWYREAHRASLTPACSGIGAAR